MTMFSKSARPLLQLLLLGLLLGAPMKASPQDFIWAPDFPVGSEIIEINAQDQDGNFRTFDDLKGDRGLLFMLSRSFDW